MSPEALAPGQTPCLTGPMAVRRLLTLGHMHAEPPPHSPAGCLVDKKGHILVPGINEAVAPVTEEELELYDKIDFDLEEYACDVGTDTLLHGCKVRPGDAVVHPPGLLMCPCQGPRGREPEIWACVCV